MHCHGLHQQRAESDGTEFDIGSRDAQGSDRNDGKTMIYAILAFVVVLANCRWSVPPDDTAAEYSRFS